MAQSRLGKSDRFYRNPVQRDEEWARATQPPWWLMILAVAIVVVASFVGVYADKPNNIVGWVVVGITIVIYVALEGVRRRHARRRLREIHGQAGA